MKACIPKILFVWLLLQSFSGNAQSPKLSFEYFREQDGLNNNTTYSSNSVLIDRHGFVWFATMSGLNRYDGYSIHSFNGNNIAPYDLPYNKIVAIAEDHTGTIWLGTMEEGIIRFDPKLETFTHFESAKRIDGLHFTQINRLAIHPDGSLIINTAFQGLYRYDIKRDQLTKIKVDPDDMTDRSLNNFGILRDGRIVVLAFNGVFLQLSDYSFRHFPLPSTIFLNRMIELPDGQIQIFAQNQADYYLLDPTAQELTQVRSEIRQMSCACEVDPQGGYWRSMEDGTLIHQDPLTKKQNLFSAIANSNNARQAICMTDMKSDDRGHVYYMSMAAGAGRFTYRPGAFEFFQYPEKGYFKMYAGRKYIAQQDSLFILSEQGKEYVPLQIDEQVDIFDYLVNRNGEYWVSYTTKPPQLIHFDANGKQLERISSPGQIFWQLKELQSGQLVMGYKLALQDTTGLPYISVTTLYEQLTGRPWPDFSTKHFTQLRNGDIWLASFASGMVRLLNDMTKAEHLPMDDAGNGQLNSNNPYYIFEGRDGFVYVSSDKGINIWNPATSAFSYFRNPRADLQDIKGMAEADDGAIWILMRHQLARYHHHDQTFSLFDLHPDFSVNYQDPRDLFIDDSGALYYQGHNGVVKVDLAQLQHQPAPDPVLITDLFVDRHRIYPGDAFGLLDASILYQHTLHVPFRFRDIGFAFVSPYGRDVGAQYTYRLKGYKDEWSPAPEDRRLHFTSLAPGHYAFEVKARSASGEWTPAVSSVTFRIAAPWYEKWWAYVLYVLVASSIAYGFYRYRVNQLLKYQRLRTRISSDLHDDVGSILGSIAMESEMLAYEADKEKAPLLQRLSALSREAMGRMRDTVWAIDARKDSMDFLTDRMKDYLSETLSRTKFTYTFEEAIQAMPIAPDIRQNVYLIFKEAINNILRHSDGDRVKVALIRSGSRFILTIHDNGQVTKPIQTSGLGMSNMKLRAEAIRGQISFGTAEGFEVRLVW